jgi:hypothetical protein
MATQASSSGECSESMDLCLWGELQRYIDLQIGYAKLPIEDISRPRQVCQE